MRGRAWRVCLFGACLLVLGAVAPLRAQMLLRSYTAEERYNHVRLPSDGAALTVWTAPVALRVEELALRFVNERDSVYAADVVVLASDGMWRPRQPRLDLHDPVRVWIGARADTVVRVRLAVPPLVHAGEQFLAGAIVRSGALTVRMDRGLREAGASLEVTRSMFALPKAEGSGWRIGSSYADGRRIGNWYIDVLARESMRASQAQLVRDDDAERRSEEQRQRDAEGRRERERRENERLDAERRENERLDAERRERERLEFERKERERREAELTERVRREAEARDATALTAEAPETGGTPRGPAEASAPVRTAPRVQPVPQSDDDEQASVLLVHVAESAPVVVRVENRRGRAVRQLCAGTLAAGSHFFAWDGTGDDGIAQTPGWYDLVVIVNGAEQARKSITKR
jgi:hypothetical protein